MNKLFVPDHDRHFANGKIARGISQPRNAPGHQGRARAAWTSKSGAGEVFGFLGPNGAGKTTTMNVLLGFVPPTSGAAYLFGIDVRQPIARQRIGYLPELTYYYKFLTAEELLRFYAKIFGLAARGNGPAH